MVAEPPTGGSQGPISSRLVQQPGDLEILYKWGTSTAPGWSTAIGAA